MNGRVSRQQLPYLAEVVAASVNLAGERRAAGGQGSGIFRRPAHISAPDGLEFVFSLDAVLG